MTSSTGQTCTGCGSQFPDGALACPSCQKLVHSAELKRLSEQAQQAERAGDLTAELSSWRSALALLPPQSRQYSQLRDKTLQLSAALQSAPAAASTSQSKPKAEGLQKRMGGLSALGVLLWKFKTFALFFLTKLKFLFLGLTKLQTLLSMLLTMGVYFTLWGWKFAIGFVLSIYVHEMGHVAALHRLGIAASAPMFVPGFGAYVRLHQYPSTPAEDARVGLAGPMWGLGAALVCAMLYRTTGAGIWGGLAQSGAYLNLFNLLPVWQLDGARGFHALDKRQRIIVTCVLGVAWYFTHDTLLLVLAGVAGYRAFATPSAQEPDQRAFAEYVLLVGALSMLLKLHVPML